jgi:putative MATE family efflux protein
MKARPGVAARESRSRRDWTRGSIIGNLFSLSWPMMIGGSINMLGPTIDMIWVGRLGAASIAGVGISGMIVMMVDSLKMGLMTGVRALIARSIGAGDYRSANHAAQQAVVVSAVFSVIIAVTGILLARPILLLMGLEPDVVSEGAAYMRIMFVGRIPMGLWMMAEAMMQASGDTVTPMKTTIAFRLFHVILCPFLIFGWWFFPRLGVSGAAVTNVLSQTVGAAIGLWFLLSARTRLRLTFRDFHFDPGMIWRIVKIGIPGSISGMERTFGQTVLIWLVAPFGTFAVASHSLLQRTDMFVFVPAMALGNAAGVLAGQNLGADQPDRAVRSGWLGVLLAEAFLILCAAAILIWPEALVRVFNSEPGVVEIASSFLRIAALSYLVMGFSSVLMSCLNNVGDTLPPMLVSLLTIWAVQVPLAYAFSRFTDLGVFGVRWAMLAGTLVGAVAYAVYFSLGKWKRKRV